MDLQLYGGARHWQSAAGKGTRAAEDDGALSLRGKRYSQRESGLGRTQRRLDTGVRHLVRLQLVLWLKSTEKDFLTCETGRARLLVPSPE